MKRSLLLFAWVPARLLFLGLYRMAHPVGVATEWLAQERKRCQS